MGSCHVSGGVRQDVRERVRPRDEAPDGQRSGFRSLLQGSTKLQGYHVYLYGLAERPAPDQDEGAACRLCALMYINLGRFPATRLMPSLNTLLRAELSP